MLWMQLDKPLNYQSNETCDEALSYAEHVAHSTNGM